MCHFLNVIMILHVYLDIPEKPQLGIIGCYARIELCGASLCQGQFY